MCKVSKEGLWRLRYPGGSEDALLMIELLVVAGHLVLFDFSEGKERKVGVL